MKKFLVFLSSVALVGSVSYAMNEEAVESEMMDEAMAAPSVKVSGSAAIGIINDSAADESLKLINEYKVSFSSNGTTDGGLVFGAGIAIEDTHDKDPEKSVKNSSVYVGGADGSWKVQFGGNDPGIDLVGAIGIAGDHLDMDDGDATVSLSGSFGGASYRLTMGDPASSGNTPKMPARPMNEIDDSGLSVTPPVMAVEGVDHVPEVPAITIMPGDNGYDVEMVNQESGKATPTLMGYNNGWTMPFDGSNLTNTSIDTAIMNAVTQANKYLKGGDLANAADWDFTDTCGVAERHYVTVPTGGTSVVISWDDNGDGADADADAVGTPGEVGYVAPKTANVDLTFIAGEHIPLEMYNVYANAAGIAEDERLEAMTTYTMNMGDNLANCSVAELGVGDYIAIPAVPEVEHVEAVEGMPAMVVGDPVHTVSGQEDIADVYIGKNNNQWSVGFSYKLDTITIGVGMDYGKGLALSLGSNVSGVDVSAYYSKSEFEDIAVGWHRTGSDVTKNDYEAVQEDGKWVAKLKEGVVGYTWDLVEGTQENTGLGVKASMAAGEGATVSVAYSTLKREIEAAGDAFDSSTDKKRIELDMSYALGGGATLHAGLDKTDEDGKDSQTKLEAKIAMSF